MPDASRLTDIHAIEQNLYRYARGVDRKDWAQVRAAYHPDAYDNHGSYKGDIGGFITSLQARHATIERSIHLISNVLVEFVDDDSALVESCFTAHQRVGAAGPEGTAVDNQSIGRYLDHVTRRGGQWRIQRRDVVFDFYFTGPATDSSRLTDEVSRSRRDAQDLLFIRRAELGLR
ncbi:nuclear transport factor 2 family protein [Bordetella petrii]|uniref:nuclear transport factor 2 family protein n=1 Tax=Bordetella petrii TaxID=94624 RepID=UPI001E53B60C|nr:nuclear transport factor 2 family protein [Bordetella petrii]MCD0503794.1 nuclear transport factor 2 family protein [Bordetella petrii]